jgi:RHS repeat-associated protein
LFTFTRGKKLFELTNHLGNVLATVSDKKFGTPVTGIPSQISYYTADVKSAQDYYPFGMEMPGRTYTTSSDYNYGFNDKEKSDEINGSGINYVYGDRIFDTRMGRFLSIDPLQKQYPMLTPYQFASNSPIANVDLDGKESKYYTLEMYKYNGQNSTQLVPSTAIIVEERGKEVAERGLFNSHGSLGHGALVSIYQNTATVKDGTVTRTRNKVGDIYIPGKENDPEEARGGLYFVSKNGGYGNASGDLRGDDAIPIPLDLLVSTVGGFPDNESVVRSASEIFTSKSLPKTALATLETIKGLREGYERTVDVKEVINQLAENLGKKNKNSIDPMFKKPGNVVFRRDGEYKVIIDDTLGHGTLTNKKATDTFPKEPTR